MILKEELFKYQDLEYKKFTEKLNPGINNIIGVRLGILRKIAKGLSIETYKFKDEYDYYEELMIEGLIIGYKKEAIKTKEELIRNFVKKINNWAICDSFCNTLKIEDFEYTLKFLKSYQNKRGTYEIRFLAVMLLEHYIKDDYVKEVLNIYDQLKTNDYYAKMAIAWGISKCFINYPDITLIYLKNNNLDNWIYNKAIQKIIESNVIKKSEKEILRKLKK